MKLGKQMYFTTAFKQEYITKNANSTQRLKKYALIIKGSSALRIKTLIGNPNEDSGLPEASASDSYSKMVGINI